MCLRWNGVYDYQVEIVCYNVGKVFYHVRKMTIFYKMYHDESVFSILKCVSSCWNDVLLNYTSVYHVKWIFIMFD